MTEKNSDDLPVLFLDTNSIHYARLLLAFCENHGLNAFEDEFPVVEHKLQEQGIHSANYHRSGYWTTRYLRDWCDKDGQIIYSPISRLELQCNQLRAVALLRAAGVDVPYRWFSRFEEREIRTHLGVDGYQVAHDDHMALERLFSDAGITISECPFDEDTWRMAQSILRSVFVDVQDAIIYASAIMEQANAVVTGDNYLGETIAYAENPGGAAQGLNELFETVREQLLESYREITGAVSPEPMLPVRTTFRDMEQQLTVTES